MFGAQQLNEMLGQHPIFKDVCASEHNKKSNNTDSDQLLHIHNGNLFVWNNSRSCLLVTNLRATLEEPQTTKVQVLMCHNPPIFKVNRILFDSQCTHIALAGCRGLSIMTLPHRWGRQAEYEGGKETIVCKCFPLAERFFITNLSVQLIQASWYPLATSPSPHICLLTSDNVLRIFNIQSDLQAPLQMHKLIPAVDNNMSMNASRISLLSMYSVTTGLGETVIAFDFGPVFDYIPKHSKLGKAPEVVQLQPIYLLQGNGDVLMLLTSLTNNKFSKGHLQGPLIMLPRAEDNYGMDSCSIRVLPTSPTTIVLATSMGKLHHCIALWTSNNDSDIETASETLGSRFSTIQRATSLLDELTPPTLYVYETVELEMDLTMEEDNIDSYPINLFGDPVLSSRYHCCTSVGVHSVVLPWISKMNAFLQEDDDNKDILTDVTHDEPCTVEHVMCTKPTQSSPPCPIKGFTISCDPLFGPAILCLTADCKCTLLPLLSSFTSDPSLLHSDKPDSDLVSTVVNKVIESSFQEHIQSILKRNLSQPLIRAGDWDSASNERECLQLVTRATQVLRDEYILKQKLARDAISKRVTLLKEQKVQQQDDLESLDQFRELLTDSASQIANDYEDCQERQEMLRQRIESVTKMVKDRDPTLSRAEIEMGKELKVISDKLHQIDNHIKQLKIKQEYQDKQYRKAEDGGFTQPGSSKGTESTRSSVQMEKYKQILFDEGDKIHELIKKLNNLNIQVGL